MYIDSITALTRAIDYYHPSAVKGHAERISRYSVMLAKAVELPKEEIDSIRTASLLHDINKIGHYEAMYHKPDGLSKENRKEILPSLKNELKILEPISRELPIIPILYHYFERYDGKGFPDGLKGENIPLGFRISAIANTFDDISAISMLINIPTQEMVRSLK